MHLEKHSNLRICLILMIVAFLAEGPTDWLVHAYHSGDPESDVLRIENNPSISLFNGAPDNLHSALPLKDPESALKSICQQSQSSSIPEYERTRLWTELARKDPRRALELAREDPENRSDIIQEIFKTAAEHNVKQAPICNPASQA